MGSMAKTRTERASPKHGKPRRETLSLHWLGNPRIVIDGREVRLEVRKAVALVVYLSVSRHRHSREFLSTLLWPEYDQQRAHANLRQCILQIRRTLGSGFMGVHRDSLGLGDAHAVSVDTEDFDRARLSLDHLLRGNDPPDAEGIRALERAVSMYRGEFLEGFNLPDCPEFDTWQMFQREDFAEKLSVLLERLIEGYAAARDWEKGIQHGLRWLQSDPSSEPAHRSLMLLYARAGRKGAALRQYQACLRALKENLGVAPEARTTELYQRIREGGFGRPPGHAPPAPPAPAAPKPVETLRLQKVSVPHLQSEFVPRLHLRAKLDSGLQVPFTLVSAPPGFGKTTLLADWARFQGTERKTAVSWLSVDRLDNDPVRFLTNLGLALGAGQSDSVDKPGTLLQPIPAPSFDALLENLMLGLRERSIPTAIVVDDFHLVTNAEIHHGLAALIEYLPSAVHLYLSTRSDPLFALSRLRSQRRIVELRTDDLRFTGNEIDSYLNKVRGLGLTREERSALEARTEGWVVGLQIAARSLDRRRRDSSSIRAFGGNHRQVMDYLSEEVLEGQDESTKRFLLETSILDRMTDSLCREVTGLAECQSILQQLERSNLFIVALDDRREWYRYHQLFMDVLRVRLEHGMGDAAVRELHARAARWYASRNLYDLAIQHGIAAGDYGLATGLITESFVNKLAHGELDTLLSWIGSLPAEVVNASAELCITKAWALLLSGLVTEAEGLAVQARQRYAEAGGAGADGARAGLAGHLAALDAYIAESRGDDARSIELARDGYRQLVDADFFTRGMILFILGRLHRKAGDLSAAEQAFAGITELGTALELPWMQATGVCDTASIRQYQGKLSEASDVCRRCLLAVARPGGARHEVFALVYFRFADILYERNKLAEASRHITLGMGSASGWTNPNDLAYGRIQLFRVRLAAGDLRGAAGALHKADELAARLVLHAHLASWICSCRAQYESATGNHREALRLARLLSPARCEGPLLHEFVLIEYARVLLRCAEMEPESHLQQQACEALAPALESARSGERLGRFIQLSVLLAVAMELSGQRPQALAVLGEALACAEPDGHVRSFLDCGAPVARMLEDGLGRHAWAAPAVAGYGERLRAEFAVTGPVSAPRRRRR
jgi:LuxR family maltose regulon positive regulatory protein